MSLEIHQTTVNVVINPLSICKYILSVGRFGLVYVILFRGLPAIVAHEGWKTQRPFNVNHARSCALRMDSKCHA